MFLSPDGARQTQLLEQYQNLLSGTYPDAYIPFKPLPSGDTLAANSVPCNVTTDYGIRLEDIRMGLFADRELVSWCERQGPDVIPNTLLFRSGDASLDRGRAYCYAAVVTDEYGRTFLAASDSVAYSAESGGWESSFDGAFYPDPAAEGWRW